MEQRDVPRERLQLRDNPELLSPPTVVEPLYQCATAVTVIGFIPHAKIRLRVNGTTVATVQADFPLPSGITISLPSPLTVGQRVAAQQIGPSGLNSPWSTPVTVRSHTQDYPAGPPRPVINPSPVYECGVRTGVGNLLTGGNVWITANSVEVGRVNGCAQLQGVNVSPAYGLNQRVRAWFELCRDPSPPSEEQITPMPPSPLPTPGFDPVYAGAEQVSINNIVNGARVTLYRNGINQGTWPCWGGSILLGLTPPFSAGETLTASQAMCPGSPPSSGGGTTVIPCSSLPAPTLSPVQAGDNSVTLASFVPGASIKVYVNGVQAGLGGGPVILLNVVLRRGDTIHVVQDLIGCQGRTAREVKVGCVDPPITYDPSSLNLFPVGFKDYSSSRVKGSVYYPAEDDGANKPFNRRLAQTGRVPIVFLVHGNHNPSDPSFRGYDYFQKILARIGLIAVSVDCNAFNGMGGSVSIIENRADLVIDSIRYFQTQDTTSSSTFFQRINFDLTGLMGHSQGGDAVVLIPEVISVPGVRIRGGDCSCPDRLSRT